MIPAKGPTGEICPNGAAARLIHKGDTVIIISYCMLDEKEMTSFKPKVVFVDDKNLIQSIKESEIAGMTHLQLLSDAV